MSKGFELPDYGDVCGRTREGVGTALDAFIEDQEPAGEDETQWREQLLAVVNEARALGRREVKGGDEARG